MGSPGHYQLIIIFLKLSFFSSDILHDICLNKLFVIVIVIVINIICIQETWVDSTTDTCVFELPNYQLITKGKYCSGHGGLFTYVHNDFQCEIMKLKEITTDWENLFITIKQKSNSAKNFIIGNIYRAPKELAQDLTIFNAEFAETLDFLQAMRSPIYLCGDFNIDLLKIHQKNQYSTFFDNLVSAGYLPRISLPTRVTDHSATLLTIYLVLFWMIVNLG